MHHPTRVSSPLRSPSFEVAIAVSPPLSPVRSPSDVLTRVASSRLQSPMTSPLRAPIAVQESASLTEAASSTGPDGDNVNSNLQILIMKLKGLTRSRKPFSQPKKKSCSKCSLWLGILCALFFLLSIALFLAWVITTGGFQTIGKSSNVCSTKQCIDIAFRLSSNMDDTVQPCENFYQYSCRKFHSQSQDQQRNFIFEQKETTLRSLLSSEELLSNATKSERLSRNLFTSCMNAAQRASSAPDDLLQLLRNFPCGPLLSDCQNFDADTYRLVLS
ncbi:unnamed protein product [Caenorhabditis auriculariae]|uniref:Peptidase M13 N-terminal domain-containing protein n=1 Tax=Caenorhabditis auriculariae TaxID=2777116 RepID=A0A8S1HFW6_9PELO|nr:unnamed protein product [Caenorhabditis auriculariae]